MESKRCTDCRQSLPILLLEERVWLWHDVAGPRFPISFSLAESSARGGNWVSLGEGIYSRVKFLAIDDNAFAHCSAIW